MRHRKIGRQLSRNASHRRSMFRNMTLALIEHERIQTTIPKAKEFRRFVEKLVTLAKKDTLHARRLVIARLGPVSKSAIYVKDEFVETHLNKLFKTIAPRFSDRQGGYTRILKLNRYRLGDGGRLAIIEFLREGESKTEKQSQSPSLATSLPVSKDQKE